jgi:hypothetical protein
MGSRCLDCSHMSHVTPEVRNDYPEGFTLLDRLMPLAELARMRGWSAKYTRRVLNARERGSIEFPRETYASLPPTFHFPAGSQQWFADRQEAERFFLRLIEQAKRAASR